MSAYPTKTSGHGDRIRSRSSSHRHEESAVSAGADIADTKVDAVAPTVSTTTVSPAPPRDTGDTASKSSSSRDFNTSSETVAMKATPPTPREATVPAASATSTRPRLGTPTGHTESKATTGVVGGGAFHRALAHAKVWYKGHRKLCLTVGAMISGCVVVRSSLLVVGMIQKARTNAYLRNLDQNVVHLFVHPRWTHGPNPFPACVAVELFLRIAQISYTVHFTNDSSMSPNDRLPFIVYKGTVLGDSDFIIQYLLSMFYTTTINRSLTPHDHATGLLAQRLVETSLSYGLSRVTFVDHPEMMADMFAKEYRLDPLVARLIIRRMRRATIKQLDASGYGDFSDDRYAVEFRRDVNAVVKMIASTDGFICGNTVSSYDCTLYAWLQVASELASCGDETLRYVASSQVIQDYLKRIEVLAFPDRQTLFTTESEQHFAGAKTV